jgi:hypothetical protein
MEKNDCAVPVMVWSGAAHVSSPSLGQFFGSSLERILPSDDVFKEAKKKKENHLGDGT